MVDVMVRWGGEEEEARLRFAWRCATVWARLVAMRVRSAEESAGGGVIAVIVWVLGGLSGVVARVVFMRVAGLWWWREEEWRI